MPEAMRNNLIGVSHMIKRLLFVLLVVALTAAVAGAQSGKIRISGTAEVLVPPDVAQVVFSVTSEDPDQATAEQKAAVEGKAILDEISALQLPKLQTRTPPSQTQKHEDWTSRGGGTGGRGGGYGGGGYGGSSGGGATPKPRPVSYSVFTVIEVWFEGDAVTLEAGLNKIVAIAYAHEATNVRPEIITNSDLEPAQQQALAQATETAIRRARVMAKAAGVKITGLSYIGPCPENARECPKPFTVSQGSANLSTNGYGRRSAGPGAPVVQVHSTRVYATVWVTATY